MKYSPFKIIKKKVGLIAFGFFILSSFLFLGQTHKLDSVKKLAYNTSAHDTTRANCFNHLGNYQLLATRNFTLAYEYLGEAFRLELPFISDPASRKKLNFAKHIGRTYGIKALVDAAVGQGDSAFMNNYRSVKFRAEANDYNGIANTLINLGNVEYFRDNYDRALDYYQSCLSFFTALNDKPGIAKANNCLATALYVKGDYARSLKHALIDLAIVEQGTDTAQIIHSLNMVGALYNSNQDPGKAAKYMERCLELGGKKIPKQNLVSMYSNLAICQHEIDPENSYSNHYKSLRLAYELNDSSGIWKNYTNLGILFNVKAEKAKLEKQPFRQHQDSALWYNNKALKLVSAQDYNALIETHYAMARLYDDLGNYEAAIEHYGLSKKFSEKIGANESSKNSSLGLYSVYRRTNRPLLALEHYETYNRLNDSVYGHNRQQEIGRLEGKFESDKKLLEQQKENEKILAVEKEKQKNQRNISAAIAALLLLVFVFSIVIFSRLRITKKQKKIIENQKKEVEKQRDIIEQHRKEVVDSIHYAKRIQQSLITSSIYIEKQLKRLKK